MQFLLDTSAAKSEPDEWIRGQLLTPLSNYALGPWVFAIDNGGFTRFDPRQFRNLLAKCSDHKRRCLFVAVPDVVGNARRTLESFECWAWQLEGWPVALVAQDGLESLPIPWSQIEAIFIGGSTSWKESTHAVDIIKTAQIYEKHVHVGRVNTIKRFRRFEDLGCDTCDGSGVVRFGWMMEAIKRGQRDDHPTLDFGDSVCDAATGTHANGEGNHLGEAKCRSSVLPEDGPIVAEAG
jgi:hypothetical protein